MLRTLSLRLTAMLTAAGLAVTPCSAHAQKALVYCPVGVDATGCNAIVAALTADATLFPGGVDAGYDGTNGTVDLATADLPGYAALLIPSLADGQGLTPYALLRNATIAGRIQAAFMGRTAVWSGTPDRGTTNRAAKDELIRNLARWAKADSAATHGPGLVALQDNSDDVGGRYGWMAAISALAAAPDTTLDVYSNVQVLTTTGQTILTGSSGLQIGYTNMASYGVVPAMGMNADATGGRTSRVVLVTAAGGPSDPNIATVRTDKEDYQPGDTVTVTGTGWEPGETVSLLFHEDVDPPIHPDKTFTAVADSVGHIVNHDYEIDDLDLDVRFTLQATGLTSGKTAQTTFTDAVSFQSVVVGTQTPSPITPGSSATYTITVGFNGNNTPTCSVALSVTTALPTGASASLSPSSVNSPNGTNQTSTLTISTTAATPAGSTTFNVRGVGTGCTGTQNGTGTLLVKLPSSTTVSGPASSSFGGSVTFTATVTGTGATPTGTVQFKDGATNLGAAQTLVSGSASVSTSALALGGHTITAVYSGDATYIASTSPNFSHAVNASGTTTALASSATPSVFGQSITLSATVTAIAPGGGTPSGSVQFKIDNLNFGASVALSGGTATSGAISSLSVGSHPVAAVYTPSNGNYTTSTSTVIAAQNVNQANTTTAVASPSNPSAFGQSFTFTASVAATAPGAGTPSGTVQFRVDGSDLGSPVTLSGASATSPTVSGLSVGTHTLAAVYGGDGNFNGSTSPNFNHTVGKANQTITFDLSALPAKTFGDADFSVASFASASSGLAVSFASGSPTRCSVSSAGLVHIITAVGNCMVVASQAGDASYNAATNVSQTFNVAKANQTISFTSTAPVGALVGGPTYTAAATATSGLTVTFTSQTTGVCTSTGTNGATITFVGGGTCTVAANQGGNGDYNAAPQVSQSFSVSAQAPQTITFTSTAPSNAVFGGPTYTVAATATSGLTVAFSSTTSGVCSVAGTTVSFVGVGTCTVAANQVGNASFLPAPQVTQSFAVGQASQTITFAALADKSYGDVDFTVSATASSGLAVSFAASGVCTVVGATVHLTGNGSCTVTASQGGNANYTAATDVPRTFTVGRASVTPHITAQPKEYDGTTSATIATRTLTGVLNGNDVSLDGGTATFADKHAGTGKTVTGSGFTLIGADADKYQLSPATATTTATISQRAITVTATTDSREYDGTTHSSGTPAITTGSLAPGDVAAFTQAFDAKQVGTGKTLTPAGSVTDGNSGNDYDVTFANVTTGVITKRALTVSAAGTAKTYDGSTTATVTLGDDRVLNDVLTLSYTSASFADRNAGTARPISVTGIDVTGTDAGNYTFNTTAAAAADINRRPITVSAVTDSRIYDGTTTSAGVPTVTTSSIVTGDTPDFTQTFDTKHVGAGKTLTPAGSVTDGNSGHNYDVTFADNTTGVIQVRPITVTAATDSKSYDRTTGSTGTPTVTTGSLAVGDVGAFTQTYDTRQVGTGKTLTPAGAVTDGNSGHNYLVTFADNTTGVIQAKALTGTITADDKEYDGTTAATIASRTLGGVIAPDVVSYVGGAATFDTRHAGTVKTVTATGLGLSGADAGNYSVNPTATTTAAINPRAITVTAVADTRIYDGSINSAGTPAITSGSLAVGDTPGFTQTFDNKNAGTGKTLTPAGAVNDDNSGHDYDVTFAQNHAGEITRRTLAVSAGGISKEYDGTTAATVTLSDDRVTNDVLTLAYATASYADKHVGTGKPVTVTGITVGGADAGNYSANTTANANADITTRPITVMAATDSKTYDGTTSSTGVPTITLGTLAPGDAGVFTQLFDTKHVGNTKTLTPAGAVNDGNGGNDYHVTFVAVNSGVIQARSIGVTATADTRVYDGTTGSSATPPITTGSLAVGDTPGFSQSFDTKHAGTNKTLTPAGAVNDGNGGNDYVVAFHAVTTGVIQPKSVTPVIVANDKPYDGTTAATLGSQSVTGTIAPDVVTLIVTAANFDTKHAGTNKTVTATGLSLGGGYPSDYQLNAATATDLADISPIPLAVTAHGVNKVYDHTTTATATLSATPLSGDVVTLNYGSASFGDKNVGTGKTVSVSGITTSGPDGGDYTPNTTATTTADITQAPLTVTANGINKVYDATTAATVTLVVPGFSGDAVNGSYTSASFGNKTVGAGKTVSVSGIAISGADAFNYQLQNTSTTTFADITRRPLTVTASAANKFFDGNTSASVTLSATPLSGDVVAISFASASFDNANVGAGKTVTVLGVAFGGADGGNYSPTPVPVTTTASILAWTLAGYYQPVDMPTGGMVWNTVKGGSTVPLKFQIFVGSVERTDVGAVKAFTATATSCGTPGIEDTVEITTTGGTELRYTGGQFIQNWQTPKSAGACYRTTMTAQDGSLLTAYFKLK